MTCHIQLKESLRFSHAFDEINTADLVAKCLPLNIRAASWPWTQMRACTLTSPFINQQPRDYGCDLQRSLELPVIYLNCPLPGSSPINALIVLTHIGNWFQNQTKLSQMINKKFLIWLPGEKETNDIYTNDNIRTGTQLHQGIPQSKERERGRERQWPRQWSLRGRTWRLGSSWILKVAEVWLGWKVERTIWPYCERYRRVPGERPVRNQLIVQNHTCSVSCSTLFPWL